MKTNSICLCLIYFTKHNTLQVHPCCCKCHDSFFLKVSEDIFTCGLPRWLRVKDPPTNAGDVGDRVWSLGGEDPLKEEMATYSSILAWEIPKTEELGRLQSMGSQRFGCNWANMHARNIQSYATSFFIHQLLETEVTSVFWILKVMLLWTLGIGLCMCFILIVFVFFQYLSKNEIAGSFIAIFISEEILYTFP